MTTIGAPDRTEAAPYFFTYIDKVPDGDIRDLLEVQGSATVAALTAISEERSKYRYEPGKWSIREAFHHVNDTERVFAYRALWFARNLPSELPSFDQDIAAGFAGSSDRSWGSIVDEFSAVRAASVALFRSMPPEAWLRRGVASGNPVSVRALAYMIVGHVNHHLQVLREKYA